MKTDAQLHADAIAGGADAFAPIVERYGPAVFGVALARLSDFHDAEEAAQTAFVEAFERIGSLRAPERLGAWLRSIALHKAIDRLRARRTRADVEPDDCPAAGPGPAENAERSELRQRVLEAVGGLSRTLRETTTLFYIDGYSVAEVARIQEVPTGTVKRRLHDARQKLQEEMMAMVEDTLRGQSPREEIAEKVFDTLAIRDHGAAPWERWDETARRLRELGTDGIDGFVRAMESPHSPTRYLAVHMLTRTGQADDDVQRLLVEATLDANRKVRKVAFSALIDLAFHAPDRRAEIVPHLLPALTDRSLRVRRLAWHLAHFPGLAEHVPLEAAARAVTEETHPDPRLRRDQRDLLDAVLRLRAGEENPHSQSF